MSDTWEWGCCCTLECPNDAQVYSGMPQTWRVDMGATGWNNWTGCACPQIAGEHDIEYQSTFDGPSGGDPLLGEIFAPSVPDPLGIGNDWLTQMGGDWEDYCWWQKGKCGEHVCGTDLISMLMLIGAAGSAYDGAVILVACVHSVKIVNDSECRYLYRSSAWYQADRGGSTYEDLLNPATEKMDMTFIPGGFGQASACFQPVPMVPQTIEAWGV